MDEYVIINDDGDEVDAGCALGEAGALTVAHALRSETGRQYDVVSRSERN